MKSDIIAPQRAQMMSCYLSSEHLNAQTHMHRLEIIGSNQAKGSIRTHPNTTRHPPPDYKPRLCSVFIFQFVITLSEMSHRDPADRHNEGSIKNKTLFAMIG